MRDIQTFIHRLSLRSQALMPWDGDRAVGLQPLLLGRILLAEFLQKKWSRNHFSFKSATNRIENPTQNDAEEKETQETIRTWNSFPALRYSEIQHLHEFQSPGRKKAQPPRGRGLQQVQEPQELQELHCPLRTRPAQPEIESWTGHWASIFCRFSVGFYPFHSFSPYVSLRFHEYESLYVTISFCYIPRTALINASLQVQALADNLASTSAPGDWHRASSMQNARKSNRRPTHFGLLDVGYVGWIYIYMWIYNIMDWIKCKGPTRLRTALFGLQKFFVQRINGPKTFSRLWAAKLEVFEVSAQEGRKIADHRLAWRYTRGPCQASNEVLTCQSLWCT